MPFGRECAAGGSSGVQLRESRGAGLSRRRSGLVLALGVASLVVGAVLVLNACADPANTADDASRIDAAADSGPGEYFDVKRQTLNVKRSTLNA